MSISPKKLSINEMWELHKRIDLNSPHKKYVIDEISLILEKISTSKFKEVLNILFPNKLISNGLEAGVLFTNGLIENRFFEFQLVIEELRGRSK